MTSDYQEQQPDDDETNDVQGIVFIGADCRSTVE